MAGDTYEIRSGVRRAKVSLDAGRTTIRAQIFHPDGFLIRETDLEISQLLSPKSVIDLTKLVSHKLQYLQMESAALRGVVFTPIEVIAGALGIPVRDVVVIR